jgi:hypothetical protein
MSSIFAPVVERWESIEQEARRKFKFSVWNMRYRSEDNEPNLLVSEVLTAVVKLKSKMVVKFVIHSIDVHVAVAQTVLNNKFWNEKHKESLLSN